MEAKVSTGECAGWFAAIMAIVRRLIMKDQDFARDTSTTMQKTSINVKYVDEEKAIVILEALRDFESCVANTNLDNRMKVPAGKIVSDFIYEAAALIKRMFVPYTRRRQEMANELFDDALESSRCFYRLGSARGLTVLRFCQNCREGQSTTIRIIVFSDSIKRRLKPNISLNLFLDPECKINIAMAQVMTRAVMFLRDFNGVKGSRMVLKDLFSVQEVNTYTRSVNNKIQFTYTSKLEKTS